MRAIKKTGEWQRGDDSGYKQTRGYFIAQVIEEEGRQGTGSVPGEKGWMLWTLQGPSATSWMWWEEGKQQQIVCCFQGAWEDAHGRDRDREL